MYSRKQLLNESTVRRQARTVDVIPVGAAMLSPKCEARHVIANENES
ncbi:hypothetical protein BH11PSE4_BH11PSE4_06940 [soil metagenome]